MKLRHFIYVRRRVTTVRSLEHRMTEIHTLPPLDPQPERREAEGYLDEIKGDVSFMPPPEGVKARVFRSAVYQIKLFSSRGHARPRPEILRERDEPHHDDTYEGHV